jgi:hypothetical protein
MGQGRGIYRVLVGKPEVKNYLEDLCVDGMIILRWIFRKWEGRTWTKLICLTIRTGGVLL